MRGPELFVMGAMAATLCACGQAPVAAGGESGADSRTIQAGETGEAAVTETIPVIVFLGDSLTAGYQLAPGAALPAAIQRRFDRDGVKARLVNAGVSGDTTADGLNRYDFSVAGSGADLLVVALGANDFLNNFPPETARKNLAAILSRAKSDGLPAVLLGIAVPDRAVGLSPHEAAYARIYPEVAAEFGVPYHADLLGAVAGKPEFLQPDGVHPTAAGVEAMAESLAEFLEPVIAGLE
ncbi:MAG: arylesterase [Alphaproteobacteria bacterium]|nr:arylesterase [Alphaproteobacteria bacterium]